MTVITAFNLDDLVAARCGARNTNGIHGGFGARVGETPHGQAITSSQHFGYIGIGLTWVNKQSSFTKLLLHCSQHCGVSVTNKEGPKAHVEVGVFVAVYVEHLRAVGRSNNYRVRVVRLETGRNTEWQHFSSSGVGSL